MVMWNAAVEHITETDTWDINNTQDNFPKCKSLISYSYHGIKILARQSHRKFRKEDLKNRVALFLSVSLLVIFQTQCGGSGLKQSEAGLQRTFIPWKHTISIKVHTESWKICHSFREVTLINPSNISNSKIKWNWSTEPFGGCFSHIFLESKISKEIGLHFQPAQYLTPVTPVVVTLCFLNVMCEHKVISVTH